MRYAVRPSLPQAVKRERREIKILLFKQSLERVVERSNDRVSRLYEELNLMTLGQRLCGVNEQPARTLSIPFITRVLHFNQDIMDIQIDILNWRCLFVFLLNHGDYIANFIISGLVDHRMSV